MIAQLIEGIAKALDAEFGDAYTIYTETIEQDLREPCFLITCISPKSRQFLGRRYLREHLFLIQYFPESKEAPRAECMEVQDRLYGAVEFITADGRLRNGTGMQGEYLDEVLHFQVQYNFFIKQEDSGPYMETLTQKVEVK